MKCSRGSLQHSAKQSSHKLPIVILSASQLTAYSRVIFTLFSELCESIVRSVRPMKKERRTCKSNRMFPTIRIECIESLPVIATRLPTLREVYRKICARTARYYCYLYEKSIRGKTRRINGESFDRPSVGVFSKKTHAALRDKDIEGFHSRPCMLSDF